MTASEREGAAPIPEPIPWRDVLLAGIIIGALLWGTWRLVQLEEATLARLHELDYLPAGFRVGAPS